ncbi:1-acyl-sn-glycerol-3-phosphate acyltransferase [Paracrocinitomix mangrovi]|uniref:1-acyl-sn-glycerol-3-phosphate acyltransferase n=1 Tax=Paracrocinitomix mangrovi TaxID=2862509 RepID=UPI001C8F1D7B|nr:1-acyl-sn-glycerol-3-phosphate acyltransferase [Paracrocinitomix mangrovi]UKN02886.1 1-acyl-sn-glycerol-3-phosphate acyltransferase [Paracrocinitomix mangrovi]
MYEVLKILSRFTLKAYFRRIDIKGLDQIKEGPYIFISNHPSAFMDPVAVATSIKPKVYFLAAGEYMGKGIKYWFMNKFLNMIPIYRPSTMPEDAHKNDAIFDKCIEHLKAGKSIIVFPEGASFAERKINPLKTGVARIVRAAEISTDFKINIRILPIGLNYSDPHKFRSDLFINIGEPIQASDYFTKENDKEAEEIKALTTDMEAALINTVIHIEQYEQEELLSRIQESYLRDLKTEMGIEFKDQESEFELNQEVVNAINYFKSTNSDAYDKMVDELNEYFEILRTNNIHDRELRKYREKPHLSQIFFIIWSAPLFLIGFIGNIIPYQITTFVQKKINVKGTFKGSIILATGMVIFSFWYILGIVLLWKLTPLAFYSLLLPVVLYLTGLQALVYSSILGILRSRYRLRKFFKANKELLDKINSKRKMLINKFQDFRIAFDNRKNS